MKKKKEYEKYHENSDGSIESVMEPLSERFVKAVREGRGMRLTAEEVWILTCVNWNTVENPKFDED